MGRLAARVTTMAQELTEMTRKEWARRLGGHAPAGAKSAAAVAVVEETDPRRFQAAFTNAVAGPGAVVLADPGWGVVERAQWQRLVAGAQQAGFGERGWLGIPTGGSSGAIKLARHDQATLGAAVAGFRTHFGVERINAIGMLPLHHVSGLMAWLRCALTGGRYEPADWRRVAQGERPEVPAGDWFLSLVPTQLQRLLAEPAAVEWLRRFRAVFVGGGPSWPDLVERAAEARLPLAFTYGMTETAAMVTALRPEEFAAGGRGCGRALPHARVMVGEDGRISIEAASLFRGYWPDEREPGPWVTEDLGRWDQQGSLHHLGRSDRLIISGGEKIDPREVEEVLRAVGGFADVVVLGCPDTNWGQQVVACYPAAEVVPERTEIELRLAGRLAGFKWPKRYVAIEPWPRNAQGKVNVEALRSALWARLSEERAG